MEYNYRNKNFVKFFGLINNIKSSINPGMLLLFVAIFTLIIANSPLQDWYLSIWKLDFFMGIGDFNFLNHHGHALTSLQLVNDGIMTIFFFSVGLEIKREVIVGELSSVRQALLPFLAAIGGMIVPVLLFNLTGKMQGLNPEELKGMAIPMATDIAFSLGVLSLLGKRAPLSLKIFLMALAIVDDIGGIMVIALFYSSFSVESLTFLGLSLIVFAILLVGNKLRINNKLFYFISGIVIWYLFLQGGIHPTIAGVLVAFMVPARPHLNLKAYTEGLTQDLSVIKSTMKHDHDESIVLTNTQLKYLTRIEAASDHVISPLQNMEDSLHDLVNYIIMPLFAFANAGVIFDPNNFQLFSGISLSIIVGLLVGKMLGIFFFTWITIKLRISRIPKGMTWGNLSALSMLGGIGFTVALFLAGLSYPMGSYMLNDARLGIIFGSLLAGLLGYILLRITLKKKPETHKNESVKH